MRKAKHIRIKSLLIGEKWSQLLTNCILSGKAWVLKGASRTSWMFGSVRQLEWSLSHRNWRWAFQITNSLVLPCWNLNHRSRRYDVLGTRNGVGPRMTVEFLSISGWNILESTRSYYGKVLYLLCVHVHITIRPAWIVGSRYSFPLLLDCARRQIDFLNLRQWLCWILFGRDEHFGNRVIHVVVVWLLQVPEVVLLWLSLNVANIGHLPLLWHAHFSDNRTLLKDALSNLWVRQDFKASVCVSDRILAKNNWSLLNVEVSPQFLISIGLIERVSAFAWTILLYSQFDNLLACLHLLVIMQISQCSSDYVAVLSLPLILHAHIHTLVVHLRLFKTWIEAHRKLHASIRIVHATFDIFKC